MSPRHCYWSCKMSLAAEIEEMIKPIQELAQEHVLFVQIPASVHTKLI